MPLPKKTTPDNMTDADKAGTEENMTDTDKITKPESYEGREKDDEGNPVGTSYIVFNNPETGERQRMTHDEYVTLRDRKGW